MRLRGGDTVRRTVMVCGTGSTAIFLSACAGTLSADELTQARQHNLNRVSTVVAHVAKTVYGPVREGIDLCSDTDESTARPVFVVNGTPTDDAEEYVTGDLDRRMTADGWTLRDRSQDGALEYIWDRDDTSLSVLVDRVGGDKPAVSVAGVGPCGERGDLSYGDVSKSDRNYLVPSPSLPDR